MVPYSDILAFAAQHAADDPLRLILQQQKYPDIDLRLVSQQLEGQRQASAKWPTLTRCHSFFYPPKINREQSSSELAARYKAQLFAQLDCSTFADLTGGMGVDTYFISLQALKCDYFEISDTLFPITLHNLSALNATHVCCHHANSIEYLAKHDTCYDLILIDPARRDSQGRKMVAFEDCTPNLLENLPLLLSRCRHLLVKASPMVDIRQALMQLGTVSQVHIVAVGGECKELLFLLPGSHFSTSSSEVQFFCTNIKEADAADTITFTSQQESEAHSRFATSMGKYLYEPNAALMKGGCYNLIGQRFDLCQLARNTHLYTSGQLIDSFPGRTFQVLDEFPLNAKHAAKVIPEGKAHVAVRNYPMTAAQLQKKLKLREGGNLFVIAATLGSRPMGWLCRCL